MSVENMDSDEKLTENTESDEKIHEKIEARCCVCFQRKPRYKCPACLRRTCSLPCVKQHKIDFNCSGRRNPAEYIERKSMGDRSLLSDYRFLEDGSRRLHSLHREINHEMFKPYPKSNRKSLYHQAQNHGFVIWDLPHGMAKRIENTTTYDAVPGTKKKKFSFFVKWTFVTASGKYVFKEENVLENWNLGRLVERALDNLNPEQNAEFIIDPGKVKAEVKEEAVSLEETESDENGQLSASSIDGPNHSQKSPQPEKMAKMIELGMRKYNFDIFMKRAQGPEKYYLIDRDKSVLSNLYGRIIAEYPEFIVTSVSTSQHYLEKLTQAVDFTRGKKAPLRPGATPKEPKVKKEKPNNLPDRSKAYEWKNSSSKPGSNPQPKNQKVQRRNFNAAVDLRKAALQDWQKEALKRANQNSNHMKSYESEWNAPVEKKPKETEPIPEDPKPVKSEEDVKKELEEKKKSLLSAMKFFDTDQISSDEDDEEDD